MTYVHTFTDITPGARDDSEPWTQIRAEFNETSSTGTFAEIETQALDPLDTDPLTPAARDMTVDGVPAAAGWFRFVFIDADGDESPPSNPIHSPAVGGATFATAADIAARLGRPLTSAEEDTQVPLLLDIATGLIAESVGRDQAWADDQIADADAPATYRLICIEVVLRGLQNPAGVESQTETLGAYSHTQRYGSGDAAAFGLDLTDAEERRLSRAAYGTNAASARLGSLAENRTLGTPDPV